MKSTERELAMRYAELLEKEMFDDIVVFSVSEPGAMGPGGVMTFYKKNGECFSVDYLSETTPYASIKNLFPVLRECYWDGPMSTELAAARTIIIGDSSDDKETCVPEGWRHIYLDFGNHLAVKKEFYQAVKEVFGDKSNCDITFWWADMLDGAYFASKILELEESYHEQKKKDEVLAKTIAELQKNSEYIRKVKEASGNLDKMMDVLEEFSGIRMSWLELKQFGFRQAEMD